MSTSSMTATAVETPYRRGYRNPAHLRDAVARAHTTRFTRTVATALVDHLSVPLVLLAATAAPVRAAGWPVLLAAVTVAVLVAARQLRALECLVHEASHFNWSRRLRTGQDLAATLLAAVPTGARIGEYRASHLTHHGRFGTAEDPDRRRYAELDLEDLDRAGLAAFGGGLVRRFGAYQRGWIATLGAAPVVAALPLLWSLPAVLLPGWLLGGPAHAALAWLAWLVTYALALPVLRLVAESGEHVYRGTDTVFDATISNLGLVHRLVFHPHGDGYHTIHHLWPGVPHHQVAALHRLLVTEHPDYRERLRYRTRVLARPSVGLPAPGGPRGR